MTGISLLLRRRFEPGTVLTIELRRKEDNHLHPLVVRVVRVQQKSRREWLVGCAFARRLSPDIDFVPR